MDYMEQFEECMFVVYQLDYQMGIYDKNGMRGLVANGWLTPEKYEKIVGEAYTPSAQPAQPAQPQA